VFSSTDSTQLTSGQSPRLQANSQRRSKVAGSKPTIASPEICEFVAGGLLPRPLEVHVHGKGQSP
jgi:hypothetical protein